MSEALIVRRGGTGGFSINAAVIHAVAPVGSTVTFSKGGVAVKTLGPGKAHTNNDGMNADYYLSVSPANYGTWSVSAVRDDESVSASVTIDSNRQYDVEMNYFPYAWKYGGSYDETYWGTMNVTHPEYTTIGDTIVGVSPGSGSQWAIVWPNAFSASRKLSKIYLDAQIDSVLVSYGGYELKFGVSGVNSGLAPSQSYCVAYKIVNTVANRQTYELDVSSVESGYLFVGGVGGMTVYNMWGVK